MPFLYLEIMYHIDFSLINQFIMASNFVANLHIFFENSFENGREIILKILLNTLINR